MPEERDGDIYFNQKEYDYFLDLKNKTTKNWDQAYENALTTGAPKDLILNEFISSAKTMADVFGELGYHTELDNDLVSLKFKAYHHTMLELAETKKKQLDEYTQKLIHLGLINRAGDTKSTSFPFFKAIGFTWIADEVPELEKMEIFKRAKEYKTLLWTKNKGLDEIYENLIKENAIDRTVLFDDFKLIFSGQTINMPRAIRWKYNVSDLAYFILGLKDANTIEWKNVSSIIEQGGCFVNSDGNYIENFTQTLSNTSKANATKRSVNADIIDRILAN